MARFSHPNAVIVHHAQLAGHDVAFFEMEYVQGQSLDKRLNKGEPMPLDWVTRLLEQLCDVLQVAHDNNIVHRDLKPANLMLVEGPSPGKEHLKVLDFGIAKILDETLGVSSPRVITGGPIGTPLYMSPEQADNGVIDHRSDLYSVGLILYEFLTGHRAFENLRRSTPPPFASKKPRVRVPAKVEQVVMRCLSVDPKGRPRSAQQLLKEFRKAQSTPSLPASLPRLLAICLGILLTTCVIIYSVRERMTTQSANGIVRSSEGTVRIELRGPSDGFNVKVDGSRVDISKPLVLPEGQHRLLVNQGDFTAASKLFHVSQGDNPPLDVVLRRQTVVRFSPPTATVFIDGRHQTLDKEGVLTLVYDGSASIWIQAKVEGYRDYSREVSFVALERMGFKLSLEKDQPPPLPPSSVDAPLSEEAYAFLKRHCYRCHGVDFKAPGLDVLDRDLLVADRGSDKPRYVIPRQPDDSLLWLRIEDGEMPPPKSVRTDRPTDQEKQLVRRWIEQGAQFPKPAVRPFVSERNVLAAIREDLSKVSGPDRRYQRYFTLANLHNNHRRVTEDELRLSRAAFAKLINSLSWQDSIVVPRTIDRSDTVFGIDLRQLGWEKPGLWQKILERYPYGLTYGHAKDAQLSQLAGEIEKLSQQELPYLRVDWFVATASRPPLYHSLLELPDHAQNLERKLGVDVESDFLKGELARAGLTSSGISKQNRMVERHKAKYGAYWRSYDFRSNEKTGNLLRFPLGPEFHANQFTSQAFEHVGGEIIFNLPNGLQGYLLVDSGDHRIDEGPTDVVSDDLKISGTPAIVNGLSCMGCHRQGIIPFKDVIRAGAVFENEVRIKIEQLFPAQAVIDGFIRQDGDKFVSALSNAIGPFLKTAGERAKDLRDFTEPVSALARLYQKDLRLDDIARELGIEDTKALRDRLQGNSELRRLILVPTDAGATIKRQLWDSGGEELSLFQRVALELDLGTPHRSF